MRVLIEEKQFLDGLWYPKFESDVLAETEERYLVIRPTFYFGKKEWVPKNGGMMRCKEIKYSNIIHI